MAEKTNPKDFSKFDDKGKALEAALAYIEKQYGKGAVMKLGDEPVESKCGRNTYGMFEPLILLWGRGVPRGRIIEIFGPESSGKRQ